MKGTFGRVYDTTLSLSPNGKRLYRLDTLANLVSLFTSLSSSQLEPPLALHGSKSR